MLDVTNVCSVQDIEKWRARESTGINFAIFYWYKILAGFFYYRVCPSAQASQHPLHVYWCAWSGGNM